MAERILEITEVRDVCLGNRPDPAENSRPGIIQMINLLCMGYSKYDGYKVKTTDHEYLILIDNGQCCCEEWGYFSSDDNFEDYLGKELQAVELTDKALNKKAVDDSGYYEESGGIQFVDFKMVGGSVLQFAVYNSHNGFYGHPIIFAKDEDILLNVTL